MHLLALRACKDPIRLARMVNEMVSYPPCHLFVFFDPIRLVRMVNQILGYDLRTSRGSLLTIQASWMGPLCVLLSCLAHHLLHHPHKADGVVGDRVLSPLNHSDSLACASG
jgi:hypothetical protein